MTAISRPALFAATALSALVSTAPARVHPHVFAEARLDVMVNPDATVRSLRHLWRFDDLFSSTVLMEFDADGDLTLNEAELKEVSSTVFTSIGEYGYFQIVTADGKDVAMKPPANLMAEFEGQQLIILFESEPQQPLKLRGKVDFGVYDPTFYTSIEFAEDANMTVDAMPSACTRAVIRPDPDTVIAQNNDTLTEAFFNDPTGNDMSKMFATKLELTCGA